MHHQIRECLGDYDKQFPDPLRHTYAAISGFVTTHLPNIRPAADLSSSFTTGKVLHAALSSSEPSPSAPHTMSMTELMCAYSVLEYKHKALQTRQKRSGKGKGGDGKLQKDDKKATGGK
jgi:hypothetical protein